MNERYNEVSNLLWPCKLSFDLNSERESNYMHKVKPDQKKFQVDLAGVNGMFERLRLRGVEATVADSELTGAWKDTRPLWRCRWHELTVGYRLPAQPVQQNTTPQVKRKTYATGQEDTDTLVFTGRRGEARLARHLHDCRPRWMRATAPLGSGYFVRPKSLPWKPKSCLIISSSYRMSLASNWVLL